MTTLLKAIKEDMQVYDIEGDKVGSVEGVQFGSEGATPDTDDETTRELPLVAETNNTTDGGPVIFATVDDMVHLPETVRDRLRMHGFLKLDTSFLQSDRIVMAEEIDSVDDDSVRLNVHRDDLLKI